MPSQPDEPEVISFLEELATTSGVAFPETARSRLLRYADLLLEWGRSINLTGARTRYELVSEHFPDAFTLAARLQTHGGDGGGQAVSIADIGSGGGLPAIPLSILMPLSRISMFEPTGKKVAFLRTAIRQLDLGARLQVAQRRVELPVDLDLDRAFEVAVSRATLPAPAWLELGWRLVPPGGRVFALGTRRLEEWPPELELVHAAPNRGPSAGRSGRLDRSDRWLNELRRST
jgi:16S rRNA (guanine(527)-N(7))-methyltransferase RsmG